MQGLGMAKKSGCSMFSDGLSLHVVVFDGETRVAVGAEAFPCSGQFVRAVADDFEHALWQRLRRVPEVVGQVEDEGAFGQGRQVVAAG